MLETFGTRTLWAMHPGALADLLTRTSIEGLLPDGLKALAGLARGGGAGGNTPNAIRDGSTFILPLSGPLSPKGSYGGTSTDRFADQVREAGADPTIGVIVVPIASPGGMVFGTAEAADAVYAVRQTKPVIAVASPYAFSAAHWIGTQCSAYYASTSAGVGAVGIRSGHVDMSGFEAKIGMRTTLIASSRDKVAGHPYAPLADDDRADMKADVDEMNRAFIAAIARGRGIKAADVPCIHGSGRTLSAKRAAAIGAIDGVMTLRDLLAKYSASRTRLALMRRRASLMAVAI